MRPRPRPSALFPVLLALVACALPAPSRAALGPPADDRVMPRVAADGAGGSYVAWLDGCPTGHLIRVLRLDGGGLPAPGWPLDGVLVSAAAGETDMLSLAADGAGGAWLAWDAANWFGSVALAHIGPLGAAAAAAVVAPPAPRTASQAGAPDGTASDTTGNSPTKNGRGDSHPAIAADGAGGVFLAWYYASRSWDSGYLQHYAVVNGAVAATWPTTVTLGLWMYPAKVLADGAGGAYVASIYGSRITVSHVAGDGTTAAGWPAAGAPVCEAPGTQLAPGLALDGAGGVLVAWADSRDATHDQVFAQRLDAAGAGQWGASGACVCSRPALFGPNRFGWFGATIDRIGAIAGDGHGGAFLGWDDRRAGGSDVYVQRIGPDGAAAAGWPADGIPACAAAGDQTLPALVGDGAGGAVLAWQDARPGEPPALRWGRVDALGVVTDGGVAGAAPQAAWPPAVAPDGDGGAWVAWVDGPDTLRAVETQRLAGPGVATGAPVHVALASGLNPAREGRTIELRATLDPPDASGAIELYDAGAYVAAAPLAGGAAVFERTLTATGPRTFTVLYRGDAAHAAGSASTLEQVLPRLPTTVALATSRTPALTSHVVTLTANVAAPGATGTVAWSAGGAALGASPLVDGVATFAHVLPAEPLVESIVASYSGDTLEAPSAATLTQQVVTRYPMSLAIVPDANPAHALTASLRVTLTPAPAGGVVTFADDDGPAGAAPLVDGVATLAYASPRYCVRTLRAAFAGDTACAAVDAFLRESFEGATATVRLTSTRQSVTVGDTLTLLATVDPATAGGRVRFRDAGQVIADVPLTGGAAVLPWRFDSAQSGALEADYSGDATYTATSTALGLTVAARPVAVQVTSSANPATAGTVVRFTATLVPAPAGGDVRFYVDGRWQATASAAGGRASCTLGALAEGTHPVYAQFSGTPADQAAVSVALQQVIGAPQSAYLHVLAPNDGETWEIGKAAQVRWDPAGLATDVDLYVSRTGPSDWQWIASVPNTGTYTWVVTGPATAGATAYVSVVDPDGGVPGDQSDLPFSIIDATTATLLSRFDAATIATGVRLTWALAGDPPDAVAIERAAVAAGPWTALELPVRDAGADRVTDDAGATPGATYWYRLVVTAGGVTQRFGPVSAVAGGRLEFALEPPAPNPAAGDVAIAFTLPRAGRARVTVVDVAGREVAVIAHADFAAGRHVVHWDGGADRGRAPAGLYFVRCVADGRTRTVSVARRD